MNIEIRDLKASDMGIVCKILSGVGVKKIKECFNVDDFITTFAKDENGKTKIDTKEVEKIGFNVIFEIGGIILENIPMVQSDVDRFLSSLTGMTIKDINDLPMADYAELIIKVIQKDDFKDFFKRVMESFNQ